jgi:hypothetical protein
MPKYLRSTHKTKNDKSGFQGVALEGGGIGGTGSAKIAGSTIPSVTIKTPVQKEEPASKPKKPVQKRKGK